MGKRYVEVFEAKRNEMEWACKREQGNMDDHDNRVVRLRGLPYGCSKEEVANFFKGLFLLCFGLLSLRMSTSSKQLVHNMIKQIDHACKNFYQFHSDELKHSPSVAFKLMPHCDKDLWG